MIEEIIKYRCSDGEEYSFKDSAEYHEEQIALSDKAQEAYEAGNTLAEVLRLVGKESLVRPIFEKIRKTSKLVISHWQCRDTPGYQPLRITPTWEVFTYGNAGSWSGSYGHDISLQDLARYAEDKYSIL